MKTMIIAVALILIVTQGVFARDCASVADSASASFERARSYAKQSDREKMTVLSGDRFRDSGNSQNCVILQRAYRSMQSSMNSVIDAKRGYERALQLCGEGNESQIRDLIRTMSSLMNAAESDAGALGRISQDVGCGSVF